MEQKIAVGYIRCSTEMQEDSPDQQKKAILEFASRNRYRIVEWFVDFGESGTSFEQRPEFMKLKKAVDSSPSFGAVISYDESRWGRAINPEENIFWRVYFQKRGVDVVLVKSSIDPKHEFAPMMNAIEAVQASQYSKKLAELTWRGSMNNGKYSNGGTPPYGYIRIAVSVETGKVTRKLAPGDWSINGKEKVLWDIGNSEEVDTVKYIFEQRKLGTACVLIAAELNEKRIPCPRRGRRGNEYPGWSSSTIRSIVMNPSYYGARVYNRNSMSKIFAAKEGREINDVKYPHIINDKSKWVIVENAHTAIVSKEDWEKANTFKNIGKKGPKERGKVKNLLTRMIFCKDCGNPYYGNPTTSKGTRIERYVCSGFTRKRICPFCSVRKDEVEYYVEKQIQSILHLKSFENAIKDVLDHYLEERPSKKESESETLNVRIKKIESEESNLIQSIAHGIDPKLVSVKLAELNREKTEINDRLKEIRIGVSKKSIKDQIKKDVELFLLTYPAEIEKLPLHRKRMLFKIFTKEVLVSKKNETVECKIRRIPAVHPVLKEIEKEPFKNTNAQVKPGHLWNKEVAGGGFEPPTCGL